MTAILVAVLLAAPVETATASPRKAQLIRKLQDDLYKVERSIEQTELLISKSRTAKYLPDLELRLCELIVEKSRYVYHLQNETRPPKEKGALVSPEVRLLKEKAVTMYARLLREHPDYKDADKVRFYMAHEQRELGVFDEMIRTLEELVQKHPSSPLRPEAQLIIADYFFDKADLEMAEKHYKAILKLPESPSHDLARYKMGWVRVNQGNHKEAVTFFEAAASGAGKGLDPKKALSVKREALLDLVYSYTEARSGKTALQYFERLADSRATYALALEKLANRYVIKQQPEFAAPALRRLLEIRVDPEVDVERSAQLYDLIKESKGKIPPTADDVRYLVRAATHVRSDTTKDWATRRKELAGFEEMARDLATTLHLKAQQKDDEKMYAEAAEAYGEYLTLFRPARHVAEVMKNRADALYASNQHVAAARQFEELARVVEGVDDKKHEEALYGALLAHRSALKDEEARSAFEATDARQALKLVGEAYLARYPKSRRVAEVKFNIARAHYDDGEYAKAARLFTAFALQHPDHADAPAAGHLALDSLRHLKDFDRLQDTGKKLLASNLPASFRDAARKVLADVKGEELREIALASAEETGDVVSGLLKVAEANPNDEIGAKALLGAIGAAREKADFAQEKELVRRFLQQYPKHPQAGDVLVSVGRRAAEIARFDEAATWLERAGDRMSGQRAVDLYRSAANLRIALGQLSQGARGLEAAAKLASGQLRAEMLGNLAQVWLDHGDASAAQEVAKRALAVDARNARAASVLVEIASRSSDSTPEAIGPWVAVLMDSNDADAAARGLWHAGEVLRREFEAVSAEELDRKVALMQELQKLYAKVAGLGSREWTVAALWRMGTTFSHIASAVESLSETPSEELAAQVETLRSQAKEAFDSCVQQAERLEVYTSAALGCRTRQTEVKPIAVAVRASARPGTPELQSKVEKTPNADALSALALDYLGRRQPHLAKLALARAIELDENRSSTHGAMGYALLLTGDAMAAAAAYRKALETDPANDIARANLAALKCRVGDRGGARKELEQIKDQSSLSGRPDVDPEWRSCVHAVSRR